MTEASRAQDLDLSALVRGLRPALLPVLLAATTLGALTFVISSRQPRVYSATASLAALPPGSGNSMITNSLVTAPPLPSGVVVRAIRSPGLTEQVIQILRKAVPANPERERLVNTLHSELRSGNFRTVTVASDVDQYNLSGSYTISAQAGSSRLAQATANAFAQALLSWDRDRALDGINRASSNLARQLETLKGSQSAAGQTVDTRTVEQMRSDTVRQLQQVEVLKQTVTGTLSLISEASEPLDPIAPKPLRNALLVFGATLFFGLLAALVRNRLIRRVRDEETLESLALPVLALVPRMPLRRNTTTKAAVLNQGAFRQSLEFVRVSLMSKFETHLAGPPIIAVMSADSGEGKSVVTAGLAMSFADRGQRVLVMDADPYRKHQQLSLLGDLHEGDPRPADVRVLKTTEIWPQVRQNIDVMCMLAPRLEPAQLNQDVRFWTSKYDIVLVDTPPALTIADTLEFVRLLDGVLLVTDESTPLQNVERLLNEIQRLGINALGFILNRSTETRRAESQYTTELQPALPTRQSEELRS